MSCKSSVVSQTLNYWETYIASKAAAAALSLGWKAKARATQKVAGRSREAAGHETFLKVARILSFYLSLHRKSTKILQHETKFLFSRPGSPPLRSVKVDEIVGAMSIMKTSFGSEELILLFGRRGTAKYRASHVLVDWVLLTWIWDVPPPCLGSK